MHSTAQLQLTAPFSPDPGLPPAGTPVIHLPGRFSNPATADAHAVEGHVLEGYALLRHAMLSSFPGRIAVVSSFGAEAALLLAWAAEIDRTVPVIFLETGKHFPETLAYRRMLVAELGLTDVRDVRPDPEELRAEDPVGLLHSIDPDSCCAIRKAAPLERALKPFAAWVTGRKRYQTGDRARLPFLELVDGRIKINPLADWTATRIRAALAERGLPLHPLVSAGYPSIGCATCTRPVRPGDDPRSGRWRGQEKTECGIHRPA
jgi:phosphoadenosine phosphosulfate reductase